MNARVLAVANQKGGVGKTTTTLNLGVALAASGSRVLLVDLDHQASLTMAAGLGDPDSLPVTVADLLAAVIDRREPDYGNAVLRCGEGVDVIPSSVALATVDMLMATVTVARERILSRMLEPLLGSYDVVLLDCAPALNMVTVNGLVPADGGIVPIAPQYLSFKGLDMLLGTIRDARAANPGLATLGVLVTMREKRRLAQGEIEDALRAQLPGDMPVFSVTVPRSVKAEEAPGHGMSLLSYDPEGPVARAYKALAGVVRERCTMLGMPLGCGKESE